MDELEGARPLSVMEGRGPQDFAVALGGVLIPYALDNDLLVFHMEASKGRSYLCPSCRAPLVFKKGDVKVQHFAHATDPKAFGCSPETVLHKTAKRLLCEWVNAGKQLKAKYRCFCGDWFTRDFATATGFSAEEEHRLASGHRADVAVLKSGKVHGVIEVFVSHRVDEAKALALPKPWVEVDALHVLSPYSDRGILRSIRAPDISWPVCEKCSRLMWWMGTEYWDPVDFSIYRPKAHTCWSCKEPTVVFLWEGKRLFETRKPPDPIPEALMLVELEMTRTSGYDMKTKTRSTWRRRYWASHCHLCMQPQGDYYAHGEGNMEDILWGRFGDRGVVVPEGVNNG